MAKKKATNERIEVSSMMKKANKEKTEAVSMVKKVSKEIKAKIEAGTKIKCPVCECVAFAKITKKDSLSISALPQLQRNHRGPRVLHCLRLWTK